MVEAVVRRDYRVAPPLVFVSYSWDSRCHQEWVKAVFVDGLRLRSVHASMDIYELLPGDKVDSFMEDFLSRCDHVAVICTPNYAKRAASEIGGVGYEKELIKRFIRRGNPEHRVVPVLRVGSSEDIPAFLGSRLYVDMRDDTLCDDLLDELTAVFYGQQIHHAPPVAAPPAWIFEAQPPGEEADK